MALIFYKTYMKVYRGANRQFKTISATIGELQLKWHEQDSCLISTFANLQRYWSWHKMAKMSIITALVFSETFGEVHRGANRQFKAISATIDELQLKWHEQDLCLISTFAN